MILTLGEKCLRVQTKMRDNVKQIDAFDFTENFIPSEHLKEILIPQSGYIFKPEQLYIFRVDKKISALNHDSFFNSELKKIGVTYENINEYEYSLSFIFPVRLYSDSSIFIQF